MGTLKKRTATRERKSGGGGEGSNDPTYLAGGSVPSSTASSSSTVVTNNNKKKIAKTRKERRNSTKNSNINNINNNTVDDDDPDELSTWQVIRRHPLVWGLLLLGLPYVCHLGMRYIVLQNPHWIPQLLLPTLQQQSLNYGLPLIRPPVTLSSERQVLIVGSMSSGTSQVATEFARHFPGFELGHEDSDTLWKFVRDGTISWFHGIRFFPPIDHTVNNYTLAHVCRVAFTFYTSSSNYGFGPTLFGTPQYQRSPLHPNFQRYWLDECQRILTAEYACTYSHSCPTPYRHTLLQVRDPWNITTSLVTKYCRASHNATLSQKPPPSVVKFLLVLLGPMFQTSDDEAKYGPAAPFSNCETLMAMYVITYYTILLDAMDHQENTRQLQHEE
jgi:hypothetical protein